MHDTATLTARNCGCDDWWESRGLQYVRQKCNPQPVPLGVGSSTNEWIIETTKASKQPHAVEPAYFVFNIWRIQFLIHSSGSGQVSDLLTYQSRRRGGISLIDQRKQCKTPVEGASSKQSRILLTRSLWLNNSGYRLNYCS